MRCTVMLIIVCFGVLLTSTSIAQIYMCTADDGTKVFSDEKCGPDAKLVPGITSKKRSNTQQNRPAASSAGSPAASTAPAAAPPPPKTAEELEALALLCNGGNVKACNEWTRSGGPKQLKANEKKLEQACESGSLEACEQRYCADGATQACRTRVFAVAGASGDNWYLRKLGKREENGTMSYNVRCLAEGDLHMRDVVVTCAANAGPARCSAGEPPATAPTMSQAATSTCSQR